MIKNKEQIKNSNSLLKFFNEDIKEYIKLCEKYNEQPTKDSLGINPYSEHAEKLFLRNDDEQSEKIRNKM